MADIEAGTVLAEVVAPLYNANPSDLTLIGGSSGGNLAANAALRIHVQNLVTLSGPFDFPLGLAYWEGIDGPGAKQHLKFQTTALGCRVIGDPSTCQVRREFAWSPDLNVSGIQCPAQTLVFNESNENNGTPTFQADLLTHALQSAHCGVIEDILPGTRHAWDYWDQVLPVIHGLVH